jgi:hypothetical protein
MRRAPFLLLLLAGCSSTADRELAAVKQAHSIVAEWAAVERLHGEGRVGPIYRQQMSEDARAQLATARSELGNPADPAAQLIDGLTQGAPDAARLAAAAQRLGALEHGREVR